MNPAPAFSRDVGRAQLGGMSMPFLDIELDEPVARLCESDYRNAFRPLCGRINISPATISWIDGSTLTLASLSIYVTSPAKPGQDNGFQEVAAFDVSTPPPRASRRPARDDAPIQFGSKMADANGTLCPFAVRVPTKLCFGMDRPFSFQAKATFVRTGPATPNAPSQLEVNSNQASMLVTQAR